MRLRTLATGFVTAAALAGLSGCTDTPVEIPAPADARTNLDPTDLENQYGACEPTSINVYVLGDTVAVGESATVLSGLTGRDPITYQPCTPDPASVMWSVADPQYGYVTSGFGGSASFVGSSPGMTLVVGSVATSPISYLHAAAEITVVPARPAIGTISGPTQVTVAGTYDFQVSASGSGPSYTYEWQKSTNGGATWSSFSTVTVGATHTQRASIPAGAVSQLRVRARTGASLWSAFSAVHSVDAVNAAPPITVWIDGYDNIRTAGTHTFEAMPSGGTGSYTYAWTLERPDGSRVYGTGKTFGVSFPTCEGPSWYNLDVVVSSGSATVAAGTNLNVEIYGC